MPEYTVRQGDCIHNIAEKYGLFLETIWNHPNNRDLKRNRLDPNVLYPGDVVFVPDKEERLESCDTGQRHSFCKKGVPAMLNLQLMQDDEPRVNESYLLEIDGDLFSGITDEEGKIEQPIPPGARRGKLVVGEAQDEYLLYLGHVDPINEISGVQARLNNLGFYCGETDGNLGPRTEAALKSFQAKYDLTESGEADEATRGKLIEVHGS
jgi:N-acetylmuramoyl-L-alanine amidase